jgi:hypothetical protein
MLYPKFGFIPTARGRAVRAVNDSLGGATEQAAKDGTWILGGSSTHYNASTLVYYQYVSATTYPVDNFYRRKSMDRSWAVHVEQRATSSRFTLIYEPHQPISPPYYKAI